MQRYRLARTYQWAIAAAVVLVAVGGTAMVAVASRWTRPPPGWFLPAWLGVLALDLVGWARLPIELTIDQQQQKIGLRSPLGRVRWWPAADVRGVRGNRWRRGITFTLHDRRVRTLRRFNGLHHFLATLQSMNPAVEISGL